MAGNHDSPRHARRVPAASPGHAGIRRCSVSPARPTVGVRRHLHRPQHQRNRQCCCPSRSCHTALGNRAAADLLTPDRPAEGRRQLRPADPGSARPPQNRVHPGRSQSRHGAPQPSPAPSTAAANAPAQTIFEYWVPPRLRSGPNRTTSPSATCTDARHCPPAARSHTPAPRSASRLRRNRTTPPGRRPHRRPHRAPRPAPLTWPLIAGRRLRTVRGIPSPTSPPVPRNSATRSWRSTSPNPPRAGLRETSLRRLPNAARDPVSIRSSPQPPAPARAAPKARPVARANYSATTARNTGVGRCPRPSPVRRVA